MTARCFDMARLPHIAALATLLLSGCHDYVGPTRNAPRRASALPAQSAPKPPGPAPKPSPNPKQTRRFLKLYDPGCEPRSRCGPSHVCCLVPVECSVLIRPIHRFAASARRLLVVEPGVAFLHDPSTDLVRFADGSVPTVQPIALRPQPTQVHTVWREHESFVVVGSTSARAKSPELHLWAVACDKSCRQQWHGAARHQAHRLGASLRTRVELITTVLEAQARLGQWYERCGRSCSGCQGRVPPVTEEVAQLIWPDPSCRRSPPCVSQELDRLLVEATRASQPGLAEDALAVAAEQGRLYLTDPDHAEGAGQLLFSDPNLNRPPNEDNRFELADYATLATGRLARIVNLGPQQGAWISYSMLVRLTLDARPLGPPVRLGAPELGPDAHQSFLLGCTTTRCLAGVVTRDEPPLQGYIVELPEPIYQDHPQPLAKWQKCGEIPRVR